MLARDALNIATERTLDLVEVAPNANPPVCRLMDYGKYLYEKQKRERESRKAQDVYKRQAKLLFQEAKHVLNGKAPQIHLRQVNQGHVCRTAPKQE